MKIAKGMIEIKELVIKAYGIEVYNFIAPYVNNENASLVLATNTRFNIENQSKNKYNLIVNLKRINDVRRINKFFESINAKLPTDGYYINNVETYVTRKRRILHKYYNPFNWIVYIIDVVFKRVFPKLPLSKKIYFAVTQGSNRVLSRAETLGRLYSCGFEIVDESFINDEYYFVVKKVKDPAFDNSPTYGPLIRLKRYGKSGKLIGVYKLRTMHPYSEYIQKYIYDKHGTKDGDKAMNDFRVTTTGKFFRKFWLDELPMLLNLFKGDLKVVGVRPLSMAKFNMYPDEFKERRMKYKPGLVPPFYVHLPNTFEDHIKAEETYFDLFDKSPISTDIKYFFKAFYNIIIKKARSK